MLGNSSGAGQARGWAAAPSNYAIEVMNEFDISAAVRFANEKNLRLVVKGTGNGRTLL